MGIDYNSLDCILDFCYQGGDLFLEIMGMKSIIAKICDGIEWLFNADEEIKRLVISIIVAIAILYLVFFLFVPFAQKLLD